jgi:tetratricopeptide (TPR) repeat protein
MHASPRARQSDESARTSELNAISPLDPVSLNSTTFLGRDLYRVRRYDDAIRACQEALEFDPDDVLALWFQARAEEANHQLRTWV